MIVGWFVAGVGIVGFVVDSVPLLKWERGLVQMRRRRRRDSRRRT